MDQNDRQVLRGLAEKWMGLASLPVMTERKRLWTALHDLKGERPMVLFESWTLEDYVDEKTLACNDPQLRGVERVMRENIQHAEQIGDDIVLEPEIRVFWQTILPDFGVDLHYDRALDEQGGNLGHAYNHPIHNPEDVGRLKHGTWKVDRESTIQQFEILSEIIGDLLPVKLQGFGSFLPSLTGDLFKLIGNDNLLAWPYDAPDALHQVMAFLRDERLMFFEYLEEEGMFLSNANSEIVGSGSPGFTSDLPVLENGHPALLKEMWVWSESQETTMISPRMFNRFFLPYIAEVASRFGLVYYGCCEPVHDRWEQIYKAIPHIRTVSISPWCDQFAMGEMLGKKVVYARKPKPWYLSGEQPDWDSLTKDLDETLQAAKDCNLEIVYRDVYRINHDWDRLRQWTDLVRSRIN